MHRLRRTGVTVVGGGKASRELGSILVEAGVRVRPVWSTVGAVRAARERPWTPIIVLDDGVLDDARALVRALDEAMQRRPPVIVVSAEIAHRSLAELGWVRESGETAPTWRVAFVRADNVRDDLQGALDDLLPGEPAPPPEAFAAAPLPSSSSHDDALGFDFGALAGSLRAAAAWSAPVVEREGDACVARCALPGGGDDDVLAARVALAWLDPAGARFAVNVTAALPTADALFEAAVPGPLGRALEWLRDDVKVGDDGFDDTYEVRAAGRGLDEARALGGLLARAPGNVDAITWRRARFTIDAVRTRSDAVPAAALGLELWRRLVRLRLGEP